MSLPYFVSLGGRPSQPRSGRSHHGQNSSGTVWKYIEVVDSWCEVTKAFSGSQRGLLFYRIQKWPCSLDTRQPPNMTGTFSARSPPSCQHTHNTHTRWMWLLWGHAEARGCCAAWSGYPWAPVRAKGEPRDSLYIYLSTIPRSLLQQTILSTLVQPADVSVTGEEVDSSIIAVYYEHATCTILWRRLAKVEGDS